jgi:hypothetical protein
MIILVKIGQMFFESPHLIGISVPQKILSNYSLATEKWIEDNFTKYWATKVEAE